MSGRTAVLSLGAEIVTVPEVGLRRSARMDSNDVLPRAPQVEETEHDEADRQRQERRDGRPEGFIEDHVASPCAVRSPAASHHSLQASTRGVTTAWCTPGVGLDPPQDDGLTQCVDGSSAYHEGMRGLTSAVLGLAAGLVMLVGVVLSFGLGLVFLFPPIVRLARATVGLMRPPELELPYRPAPLSGRHLAWHERLAWLINDPATWRDGIFLIVNGLLLGTCHHQLAAALLAPTSGSRLARRVNRLTRARADVVDHQAAELRRIERDLHDGAQSRLVAVGMTMNAAEELIDTDPRAAKALLAKGRDTSQDALQELRQLIGGIHPPVLAERGLTDAIEALTLAVVPRCG